jgi:low temperature requirement protein LtrA
MTDIRQRRSILPPPAFWCDHGHGDGNTGAGERRVTWIELFFDLVFVAAVAQVSGPLAHDFSFDGLGRYAFLLFVIWWAWSGHAVHATRFDADDGRQRTLTLLQMIGVIFMAANAEQGLDSVSSAGFAAAYAVTRLILVLQYVRAAAIARARPLTSIYAKGFGAAACFWLVSAFIEPPMRYGLWTTALMVEVFTARRASRYVAALPPHATHLPERFGLFTMILLGESIIAIMKGIQAQPDWSPTAAGVALGGIGFTFLVWWVYFEYARGASDRPVRTAHDRRAYEVWTYAHVPLYLGMVLSAVGVEHLIKQGTAIHLTAEEASLLGGALAVVLAALRVLRAVRPEATAVTPPPAPASSSSSTSDRHLIPTPSI